MKELARIVKKDIALGIQWDAHMEAKNFMCSISVFLFWLWLWKLPPDWPLLKHELKDVLSSK